MPPTTSVSAGIDHGLRAAVTRHVGTTLVEHLEGPRSRRTILAIAAIEAKAAQLGGLPGAPGTFGGVAGGWVQTYAGCDIYYSQATGAHEVHGDIRDKYNVLGGAAGRLGFPLTDETGTPDGVGRYNHFQHGSIYWTPHTGPMMVAGRIRDVWAAQGWERGPLGYPVADEERLRPYGPADHPKVAWSLFENGAISENAATVDRAFAVDIPNEQVRRVLRIMVDTKVHESPDNVGLHAPVETLGVSGWGYGFHRSQSRIVTLRLHGFRDNGLAPDTNFELDMSLRFGLRWTPQFLYPPTKSLVASLTRVTVTAHGLGSQSVADGVRSGIEKAFFRGGPDPQRPEVGDGELYVTDLPTGAKQTGDGNIDLIDVMTTAQGGLQVLVAAGPIVPGGSYDGRRTLAQRAVDAFLASV